MFRHPFNCEEDLCLWEGYKKLGTKWAEISRSKSFFNSTRSENQIKGRWYSPSFKQFISNEFDPDAYSGCKASKGTVVVILFDYDQCRIFHHKREHEQEERRKRDEDKKAAIAAMTVERKQKWEHEQEERRKRDEDKKAAIAARTVERKRKREHQKRN